VKNVEANKVSGVMSRLLKNEEGNIIALFAAAVIPVLGLVGGGFDMSRIYLSQTRLQGACDAGALIGHKTMGLGKWADNSNAANKLAEKLFKQNFPSGAYGTTNRVFSFAESNGNVTGTASVTVPMTLMRVLGQESQVVNVNCQAELRVPNTDVMFVEMQYYFKLMIVKGFSNLTDRTISQVASMVVRENRDTVGPPGSDGVYNDEKATPATCPWT
jgi:Flp pilus assembly protein TadG